MLKNHEKIFRLRDQQLRVHPSTRHAFVITINRLVSPPKIGVTTVEGYEQWRENPHETPKLAPPARDIASIRAKNTIVYPGLAIPFGADRYAMTIEPETASEMFGWKAPADSGDEAGLEDGIQTYVLPEGFPYTPPDAVFRD